MKAPTPQRMNEPGTPKAPSGFDVEKIRKDFPITQHRVNGKPLVYLDNAATTQKPFSVIRALEQYYTEENANIHRGVHYLSEKATELFEEARHRVQTFLNAGSAEEIVFVRGATEGINLVAATYGRLLVKPGDEILISAMEHHSNLVPWQMLCEERGAVLRVMPMNERGELQLEEGLKRITPRTKLVSLTQVSNALGTVNPLADVIAGAHRLGVPVLVDGAQAVAHLEVDVRALDCDFYVFSGHKVFGPTGIGVLYGKRRWLEALPPYQGGGDMIRSVTFEKTTYNALPYKFEAGTPHIAGVIGLGAALDYVLRLGRASIAAYEHGLLDYLESRLVEVPTVRLIGTAAAKASITSFMAGDVHAHDVGTILDQEGVAVRAGHHCAMPVMDFFHVPATVRASLAFYNTREEVDIFVRAVAKVIELFS